MPIPKILAQAVADVVDGNPQQSLKTDPDSIKSLTSEIRTFDDALTALPTSSHGGTCKDCFSQLYDKIRSALLNDPALVESCKTPYLQKQQICLKGRAAANKDFHNCIGGMIVHYKLRNDKCTADEWSMYGGVFRAYGAISHCSDLTGDAYEECRMGNSGLPMPDTEDSCLNCWDKLPR